MLKQLKEKLGYWIAVLMNSIIELTAWLRDILLGLIAERDQADVCG